MMGKTRTARPNLFLYVMLVVVTLVVYWQVAGFDFVQFDDDGYVASCTAVQVGLSKGTIAWAFTTPYQANYHPLTWISLMLDREVSRWSSLFTDADFGALDPQVFHVTNLLLHLANVLLLLAILNRVTGFRWRSALVAELFAIHPQHGRIGRVDSRAQGCVEHPLLAVDDRKNKNALTNLKNAEAMKRGEL